MKNALGVNLFDLKESDEVFFTKAKERVFSVIYFLSKKPTIYASIEKISIIFQLLQLLVFSLNINFSSIWKQESLFSHIQLVMKYFQIVPFFENNLEIYLLAYYACSLMVLFLYGIILYLVVSKNQPESMFFTALNSLIIFITVPLYLPIMTLFASIFSCNENTNIYVPTIQCWSGIYYLHAIVGILMLILFACLSYIFVALDSNGSIVSLPYANDQNIKITSSSDRKFLIGKTLLVILFTIFDTMNESAHWFVITIASFISAYIFFDYYLNVPYINDTYMYYVYTATSIYLWSNFCLIIGKILESTSFNGTLFLFLVSIPIIIIFIYTIEPRLLESLINRQKRSANDLIHSILKLLIIIDNREKYRDNKILFDGYISLYEEHCHIKSCPLKQYLFLRTKNSVEKTSLLYQHVEILYTIGITKFPNSSALRISFGFFLLVIMNKKNRALSELANAELLTSSLEENYKIYKYREIIHNSEHLTIDESNDELKNNIIYKKEFNVFKSLIRIVSSGYIDFLTILLVSNQDNKNDLEKLNNIGKIITKTTKSIQLQYDKLQKMKYNDKETIICYSDFLMNVINDKDKANHYRSLINTNDNLRTQNEETFNLNASALSSTDESQYMIVSSQPESFGIITNISLGLCSLFGYSKNEIIGKNYELLMPELYSKPHKELLELKAQELRKNCDNYYQYKELHVEKSTYAINRSKYLIQMDLIIGILPNESNDYSFIAKVIKTTHEHLQFEGSECYVLTNTEFIIQHFTPNAITLLELDSKHINSTDEITQCIKEFHEEFLNKATTSSEEKGKTHDQNLLIKHEMIKTKYNNPITITWQKKYKKDKENTKETSDPIFNLTIYEQKMRNKIIGFIFKLEYVKEYEGSNMTSLKSFKGYREKQQNQIGKIEKDYVPELINKFNFDSKEMSFKYITPDAKGQQIREENKSYMKKIALEKITITNNTNETKLQSSEDSSDIGDSNSNQTSQDDNENSDSIGSKDNKNYGDKASVKQNDDEYYKIDFTHIKFKCYDFNKKQIIEQSFEKLSLMEIKMNENYKEKEDSLITQKASDSQGKMNFLPNQLKDDNTKESQLIASQNEIILKQIENALSIKESQPTIIYFFQLAFFILILFLATGAAFMSILCISFSNINESALTIENSYDIVLDLIYSQFFAREITLLSNENYTVLFYENKQLSFDTMKLFLVNKFNSSNTKMNQIITTVMPMTSDAQYYMNNKTIPVYIIQNDAEFSMKSFDLTLKAAFIETNTAMFHITTFKLDELIPTQKDIHFFLRNSMNDVFIGMYNISTLMVDELQKTLKNSQYYFIIPFVLAPIILLSSFFFISHGYREIAKRKESYLEVFFEIGKNIIQKSLECCEYFNKKIQSDSVSDLLSVDDNFDFDMNDVNQPDPLSNNRASHSKKKSNSLSKETLTIQLNMVYVFTLVFLFFILIFTFLWIYLNSISMLFFVYKNTLEFQINNCCSLNVIREYLFDYNTPVYMSPPNSIDSLLSSIYMMIKEKEELITDNIDYFSQSFKDLYVNINEGDICPYAAEYFENPSNGVNCETFLYGSAKRGMKTLLTSFSEEIRFIRNHHNIAQDDRNNHNFNYNMTLTGSKLYGINWPTTPELKEKYAQLHPIHTFNLPNNKDIVIVYLFFMTPAYADLNTNMKNNIHGSLNKNKLMYSSLLISYMGLVFVLFLFIIIPFIRKLNQTIYKTKNMLKIIPSSILYTIPNILIVLDIGTPKTNNINNNAKN